MSFQHKVLTAEESITQAITNTDLEFFNQILHSFGKIDFNIQTPDGITILTHAIIKSVGQSKNSPAHKILASLLNMEPDLSVRDSTFQRTALHYAVILDARDILQILLEKGADSTQQDIYGMNPLHLAVEENREAIIQIFLKNIKIEHFNQPDGLGRTCLIHAIQQDDSLRICQRLINSGIDVNIREYTSPRQTALHTAALLDLKLVVDILLKAGADLMVIDDNGRIPLHLGAMNPAGECFQTLLRYTSSEFFNLKDKQGMTPLLCAAKNGSAKQLKFLIKRGADLLTLTDEGKTCVHLLAENSEANDIPGCLQVFRERQPTLIDTFDNKKQTPLMLAASSGNPEAISGLLNVGAGILLTDGEHHTALHWAAVGRNPDCTRLLAAYLREIGGDLNQPDNRGATPLHYSVQLAAFANEKLEADPDGARAFGCCDALLSLGAAPNSLDNTLSTPLLWCSRYPNSVPVIQLLRAHKASIDTQNEAGLSALHIAAQQGILEACRCLIEECGINGNLQDEEGQTPLFYAIQGRNLQCFEYLLSAGAATDYLDIRQKSVAHLCCVLGLLDYLKLLFKYGANLDQTSEEGIRPSHDAVVNGQLEILKFLIQIAKSDPYAYDKNGFTLLHYTVNYGKLELVKFLVEEEKINLNQVAQNVTEEGDLKFMTPLDLAELLGHANIKLLLENNDGKPGTEIADRASRKIQRVIRKHNYTRRQSQEQTQTSSETTPETLTTESRIESDLVTSEIEDIRSPYEYISAPSPFHVPTPLINKRYLPGLHKLGLATPPLRVTTPQSAIPYIEKPRHPAVTDGALAELDTKMLGEQLTFIQQEKGYVPIDEAGSDEISPVSFLAAGTLTLFCSILGGDPGDKGMNLAGAVLQGELETLKKEIEESEQIQDEVPPFGSNGSPEQLLPGTPKKGLDPIVEHPDYETASSSYTDMGHLKELAREASYKSRPEKTPSPELPKSIAMRALDELYRAKEIKVDLQKRLETAKVDQTCRDLARRAAVYQTEQQEKTRQRDKQFWDEFQRIVSVASNLNDQLQQDILEARNQNNKLDSSLAEYGMSRRPTVAQWLEQKRQRRKEEMENELIKWDGNRKRREAYVSVAKQVAEERSTRHSTWTRQKDLSLLNLREKQKLFEVKNVDMENKFLSSRTSRNPYVYEPKSQFKMSSTPWFDSNSFQTSKIQSRPKPQTQPIHRANTSGRQISGSGNRQAQTNSKKFQTPQERQMSVRITENGLMRIATSAFSQDYNYADVDEDYLDPAVQNSSTWRRATGPKNTPKNRSLVFISPNEYERIKENKRLISEIRLPDLTTNNRTMQSLLQ